MCFKHPLSSLSYNGILYLYSPHMKLKCILALIISSVCFLWMTTTSKFQVLWRSFKEYIFNVLPVYNSSQLSGASIETANLYPRYFLAGDILKRLLHCEANTCADPLRTYQVVVATTRNMGIGKDGKLPWRLPSDLQYFKELTISTSNPSRKNAVIMGRKTWESIPLQYRPLPGRLNVVLTRSGSVNLESAENLVVCRCFLSALKLLAESPYSLSVEKVFVIGGGQILRWFISYYNNKLQSIYAFTRKIHYYSS